MINFFCVVSKKREEYFSGNYYVLVSVIGLKGCLGGCFMVWMYELGNISGWVNADRIASG